MSNSSLGFFSVAFWLQDFKGHIQVMFKGSTAWAREFKENILKYKIYKNMKGDLQYSLNYVAPGYQTERRR